MVDGKRGPTSKGPPARRGAVHVLTKVAVLLLVVGAFGIHAWLRTGEHSRRWWICLECGMMELREVRGGVLGDRVNVQERVLDAEGLRDYRRWYDSVLDRPHDHLWRHSGCGHEVTRFSVITACSSLHAGHPWFAALPELVDRDVAVYLFDRLGSAGEDESFRLMVDFNRSLREEKELWATLRDGTADEASRREAFRAFLAARPQWGE